MPLVAFGRPAPSTILAFLLATVRNEAKVNRIGGILLTLPIGLLAALPGCVSPPQPAAPSLAPHDPTPLAKCKVAANQSSPLVTEWPASEKSRLEALVAQGGVAVAYSGCEMRVLPDCRVKGQYAYTRTTLATDTTEVTDADELYSKLPLGAVSLEGDLNRAGRLAVQTTVAGQLMLKEAGPGDVPKDGACAAATHLVTGMSLGAFRLLAGGKASAKVGASGFGGEVGAGRKVEESVLRETGEASACGQGEESKPNERCKSPLQVFLAPLPGREAPSVERRAMAEERPSDGAVRVNFKSEDPSEKWTLLTKDDKFVCDLPCTRWVGPRSGLKLKLDAAKVADLKTVEVPAELGYTAGRSVNGTVSVSGSSWKWIAIPIAVMIGGGTMMAVEVLNTNRIERETGREAHSGAPYYIGLGVVATGTLGAIVVGTLASSEVSYAKVDISLAPDPSEARLEPGYVSVKVPSLRLRSVITPFGAAGTF